VSALASGPFRDRLDDRSVVVCRGSRYLADPPPPEGGPECRCSRCNKRIGKAEIAWRITEHPDSGPFSRVDYGYCERCQRSEGVTREQAEARRNEQQREREREAAKSELEHKDFLASLRERSRICSRCGEPYPIRSSAGDDFWIHVKAIRKAETEHEARCLVPDFQKMLAGLPQAEAHSQS
jgi:hypothetical protein